MLLGCQGEGWRWNRLPGIPAGTIGEPQIIFFLYGGCGIGGKVEATVRSRASGMNGSGEVEGAGVELAAFAFRYFHGSAICEVKFYSSYVS